MVFSFMKNRPRALSMPQALLLGTTLAVLLATSSCSYSFKGSLPAHLKVITIPMVENETAEFGISQELTELLRNRTLEEGLLRLGSEETADCSLLITLLQINDSPHDYDESETLKSIRTTLKVNVSFVDLVEGQELWVKSFNEWGEYEPDVGSRDEAIAEAVDKLIQAVHEEMLADW
jgi:hypothetical protein